MADIETVAVAADGTPIATMKIIDKETGTETPVNVATCAEGVTCNSGKTLQKHLEELHAHADDEGAHLTAEEKAGLETKAGAQEKATAAKNEAIAASSLEIAAAKNAAADDATEKANAARDAAYRYCNEMGNAMSNHHDDHGNPHNVTAEQVGLGNVPNKTTNDLQPTYTQAETLTELSSGEKLAVAFGKIAKAIADFISHLANNNNPHGVTASQAGAVPKTGGTMTGTLTVSGLNLTEGKDYGPTLPKTGTKGQLFFLED